MIKRTKIGVLAFQGDVTEHVLATEHALKQLHLTGQVTPVRTKAAILKLDALIIPGGESTVLYALCERAGMVDEMKKIPYIFGTCAGAILLSHRLKHTAPGQKTLGLMNITVDRNAYGAQTESFEKNILTPFGQMRSVFIRAPRIVKIGPGVTKLIQDGEEILACEQNKNGTYYLAASFHPELTTTKIHEYFLKKVFSK